MQIPDYAPVNRYAFGVKLYEELVDPVVWNHDTHYGPRYEGWTSMAPVWIRTGSKPVEQGWVVAPPWKPGIPPSVDDPELVRMIDMFDDLLRPHTGEEVLRIWL